MKREPPQAMTINGHEVMVERIRTDGFGASSVYYEGETIGSVMLTHATWDHANPIQYRADYNFGYRCFVTLEEALASLLDDALATA